MMGTNFSPQQAFIMSGSSFGSRVAQLREKKGWTQSDLARKLNKSPQAVQKWEKGGAARGKTLDEIARELNTTTAYLLSGDTATALDAHGTTAGGVILVPLVKWKDVGRTMEDITKLELYEEKVPAISGIHGSNTVCTIIEGGDWMDLKDGTMVFVNKGVDAVDLRHGAYVIADVNGQLVPRKLLIDGGKKILVTTSDSLPKREHEVIDDSEIVGHMTGAYIPFS